MLKHWLGNDNGFTAEDVIAAIGIGNNERRPAMYKAILDNPHIPDKYAHEIVDLGLKAGTQALASALDAVDNVAELGSHPGVREAITQIAVQVFAHAAQILSQSMVNALLDKHDDGMTAINLMEKSSGH